MGLEKNTALKKPEKPEVFVDTRTDPEKRFENSELLSVDEEFKKLEDKYNRFMEGSIGSAMKDFFSKNNCPTFKPGEGFYFVLKENTIVADVRWVFDDFLTLFDKIEREDMFKWAHFHEGIHAQEYRKDAEGSLATFEYSCEVAPDIAAEVHEAWKARDDYAEWMKEYEGGVIKAIEGAVIKSYNRMFNIFEDVFVNHSVANKVPLYRHSSEGEGEGGAARAIQKLYREVLFKSDGDSYENAPKYLQLTDSLLRDFMLLGTKTKIDTEISDGLQKKLDEEFGVDKMSIDNFVQVVAEEMRVEDRTLLVTTIIEPLFREYLIEDFKNGVLPNKSSNNPNTQGGDKKKGESGEGGIKFDPNKKYTEGMDKYNPDRASDEGIKKELEKVVKKQREEDEKTSETLKERKARGRREGDNKLQKDFNITQRDINSLRKIQERLAPHSKEFERFIRELLRKWGKSKGVPKQKVKRRRDGILSSVVNAYVQSTAGNTEPRVFSKQLHIPGEVPYPEFTRLTFIIDESGSTEGGIYSIQRDAVVALCSACMKVNKHSAIRAEQGGASTRFITKIIGFSNSAEERKRFSDENTRYSVSFDTAELANFTTTIPMSGGTNITNALSRGLKSIKEMQDAELRKVTHSRNKKTAKNRDIVIFLTDGGGEDDADTSRSKVEELVRLGATVVALQFGEPDKHERTFFQTAFMDMEGVYATQVDDLSTLPSRIIEGTKQAMEYQEIVANRG